VNLPQLAISTLARFVVSQISVPSSRYFPVWMVLFIFPNWIASGVNKVEDIVNMGDEDSLVMSQILIHKGKSDLSRQAVLEGWTAERSAARKISANPGQRWQSQWRWWFSEGGTAVVGVGTDIPWRRAEGDRNRR